MLKSPATWATATGLTPYEEAVAAMRARIAAIRAREAEELIWLVEHPSLYTAGTSAKPADLTDPTRFPTFAAGRGGEWTYHGPGQRVVYTMLDLTKTHGQVAARDVREFVHGLEAWMIAALAEFGITGETRQGRVGIWVVLPGGAEAKIGAIGVRVSRWVSWHGMALNIHPELANFTGIVPCGISQHGVTSFAALGVGASMADVDLALRRQYSRVFA